MPFGRIYKDGRLIGDDQAMGIRDRRKLSFAGHVAVNVVLDEKYEIAGDPDLVAIGVAAADASGEPLEELMIDAAIGAIDSIPRVRRKDIDLVAEVGAARRACRRQRGVGQEADRHRVHHALERCCNARTTEPRRARRSRPCRGQCAFIATRWAPR